MCPFLFPRHCLAVQWPSLGKKSSLPIRARLKTLCLRAAAGDLEGLRTVLTGDRTGGCAPEEGVLFVWAPPWGSVSPVLPVPVLAAFTGPTRGSVAALSLFLLPPVYKAQHQCKEQQLISAASMNIVSLVVSYILHDAPIVCIHKPEICAVKDTWYRLRIWGSSNKTLKTLKACQMGKMFALY